MKNLETFNLKIPSCGCVINYIQYDSSYQKKFNRPWNADIVYHFHICISRPGARIDGIYNITTDVLWFKELKYAMDIDKQSIRHTIENHTSLIKLLMKEIYRNELY